MEIPLTQGKFAIVGPRDYKYLMQWKWHYNKGYAARQEWSKEKKHTVYMHRVILARMGNSDFAQSDHINRDKLDNRRGNLRPATMQQSLCNRNMFRNNTSGYTGVTQEKRSNKWAVRIRHKGRRIYLGQYDDRREAAKAYNKAAQIYRGEFAVLNDV